jgi:hypothetical protein
MSPQDDVNRRVKLATSQRAKQPNFSLDAVFVGTNPRNPLEAHKMGEILQHRFKIEKG